jgi:hypothetical protein
MELRHFYSRKALDLLSIVMFYIDIYTI